MPVYNGKMIKNIKINVTGWAKGVYFLALQIKMKNQKLKHLLLNESEKQNY